MTTAIITIFISIFFITVNSHGQTTVLSTPSFLPPAIQATLEHATSLCHGCSYEWLNDSTLQVARSDGTIWTERIQPSLDAVHIGQEKFPNMKTVEIIVTDDDTARYSGRIKPITLAPVALTVPPAVFVDTDGNGLIEAYGFYYKRGVTPIPETRVYEAEDKEMSRWILKHVYESYNYARVAGDMNRNGRNEVLMENSETGIPRFYAYESKNDGRLAVDTAFVIGPYAALNNPRLADVNNDGYPDFFSRFIANDQDSVEQIYLQIHSFQESTNSVERVWYVGYRPYFSDRNTIFSQISIQDADDNGRMEFLITHPNGNDNHGGEVFITEWNGSGRNYDLVWHEEIPQTFGMYWNREGGDLNGDGRKEYYVVGTVTDSKGGANLIYRIEPKIGGGFEPTLKVILRGLYSFSTRNIYTADIDGDGKREMTFSDGNGIVVFEPVGLDSFRVFWKKFFPTRIEHKIQDLNKDRFDEIIIGLEYADIIVISDSHKASIVFAYDSTFVLSAESTQSTTKSTNEIELYPTIVGQNSVITINGQGNTGQSYRVTISDVYGRVQKTHYLKAGQASFLWDAMDQHGKRMSKGLYFITLRNEHQNILRRILYY